MAAKAGWERELVMLVKASEEPSRGITETFTRVSPPGSRSAHVVTLRQFCFTPLRAPAEFPARAAVELGLKYALPTPSRIVRKTHPSEMEELMYEDALEFMIVKRLGIKKNEA
jgi:hypothetical protein